MSGFQGDEISDEERLQIAQHFLMSSPPGQFNDVLNDTKKILPPGFMKENVVSGIARNFNNKFLRVATTPSGQKFVINPTGEVETNKYRDNDNAVYSVDPVTLATSGSQGAPSNDPHESHRAALQQVVNSYVTQKFPCPNAAGTVTAKGGIINIYICSERPNLRNYWSGKWSSVWTVAFEGNTAKVAGDIKIHCHYFEDGNIQMISNKSIPSASYNFNTPNDFASAVMNHIRAAEGGMQNGLEDMYANMNDETIKSMRRLLPITRTKMDWNVNAVRMVRQVRK